MTRKLFLAMMCTIMSIALLAGCSDKKKTVSEEGPDGKPMLEFWTYYPDQTNIDGFAMNTIRETFDVDVEFLTATVETKKESLQLAITSGDIPDWWKDLSFPDFDKLVDQDVVAAIPEEYFEKYTPKYLEWLKKYLGDDPFRYSRRDGKIYAMPDLWTIGENNSVIGFRKDWLEKVGISKTPETLSEMEEALKKFHEKDPDGNGKKDTYGITGTGEEVTSLFTSIFGAFGVYPGIFSEENGEIVRGEIQPGAKEALKVLNRWYEEELIDPEFVVNKSQNVDDKILGSKVGALQSSWWTFIPEDAFISGIYYEELRKDIPDADWVMIAGPKGPNGDYGIVHGNPVVSSGIQFGKQLEDDPDKMIKYMQIFEATSFDRDMYEKVKFGEEGTTFKKTDDGGIELIPPYDQEEEQVKFGFGYSYSLSGSFNDYDFQAPYMTKGKYRDLRKEVEPIGEGKYDLLQPAHKPIYNEYHEQLERLTLETFIDIITGKEPVSEFDNYVEKWKKLGGDEVMEEAQQVYDELF